MLSPEYFDLESVWSIKLKLTKLTTPIFKKGNIAYICLKEKLLPGEIIETGDFKKCYKIVKLVSPHPESGGWKHRIIRIDGASITSNDMEQTHKGDNAIIKSRKTFNQIFKEATEF